MFEDVTIYFSQEEWELLNVAQILYVEVVTENSTLISSLGCSCAVGDEKTPCKQVSEKSCVCGTWQNNPDTTDPPAPGNPLQEEAVQDQ